MKKLMYIFLSVTYMKKLMYIFFALPILTAQEQWEGCQLRKLA